MKRERLGPERLVFGSTDKGRYEVWHTPHLRRRWHLYYFENEVEITRKPFASETSAREEFERKMTA